MFGANEKKVLKSDPKILTSFDLPLVIPMTDLDVTEAVLWRFGCCMRRPSTIRATWWTWMVVAAEAAVGGRGWDPASHGNE